MTFFGSSLASFGSRVTIQIPKAPTTIPFHMQNTYECSCLLCHTRSIFLARNSGGRWGYRQVNLSQVCLKKPLSGCGGWRRVLIGKSSTKWPKETQLFLEATQKQLLKVLLLETGRHISGCNVVLVVPCKNQWWWCYEKNTGVGAT